MVENRAVNTVVENRAIAIPQGTDITRAPTTACDLQRCDLLVMLQVVVL